ncbi:hypothetical protein FHU38_005403 [Saccharomonospora amisosensis]|uniref:Uncharacterized protein n=1 Tax=Saccharomonospora amisosensis TaxID=1128677 RepID=A0A7X5ZU46_9PSEU|nr:hypothetical protein [Saccharomonospora amisosensis]NIJ14995.1 hypothetical protein [Saccharomonospora amisosensis]
MLRQRLLAMGSGIRVAIDEPGNEQAASTVDLVGALHIGPNSRDPRVEHKHVGTVDHGAARVENHRSR